MSDPIDLDEMERLARLLPPAGPEPFWAEQVLALIERVRRAEAGLAAIRKLEREGDYCSMDWGGRYDGSPALLMDLDRVLKEHGA